MIILYLLLLKEDGKYLEIYFELVCYSKAFLRYIVYRFYQNDKYHYCIMFYIILNDSASNYLVLKVLRFYTIFHLQIAVWFYVLQFFAN